MTVVSVLLSEITFSTSSLRPPGPSPTHCSGYGEGGGSDSSRTTVGEECEGSRKPSSRLPTSGEQVVRTSLGSLLRHHLCLDPVISPESPSLVVLLHNKFGLTKGSKGFLPDKQRTQSLLTPNLLQLTGVTPGPWYFSPCPTPSTVGLFLSTLEPP